MCVTAFSIGYGMMIDIPVCQSYGMPMDKEELKGTEKDMSRSEDYCMYCYAGGVFTRDMTMEEMILTNIQFLDQCDRGHRRPDDRGIDVAKLRKYLPTLKRWK